MSIKINRDLNQQNTARLTVVSTVQGAISLPPALRERHKPAAGFTCEALRQQSLHS